MTHRPHPGGRTGRRPLLLLVFAWVAGLMLAAPAWSLPSFAQQTGVGCAQCHTAAFGPELTQFGREFKLNGYTLGSQKSVPLSAMAVFTYNQTGKGIPGGAAPHFDDNDNFAVNEISGFFAGRISDHFGGIAQVTYSGVDRVTTWDNLDFRFADNARLGKASLLYGLSLNNNPTIQDLWNSTPGWGFPSTSSELAPTPAAAPIIDGALAQQVLGLTAYTEINDWLYLEAGGYGQLSNSLLSNLGLDQPSELDHVHGTAPYWRAALQHEYGQHYVSAGIFGLNAALYPGNDRSQGTDSYTDFGYDATYQYADGVNHAVTAQASYVREDQRLRASNALEASDRVDASLNETKLNVQYAFRQTYVATVGYFDVGGSHNAALYAPDPVDGSANGSPDSRGYVLQADWIPWGKLDSPHQPWMNLRLGLQYTAYDKFNGGDQNYDGFGRSASDNNTWYLFAWLAL
ncbi:MAG TPA: hypothetical protein VF851_08005 [Steroidobacteraceae bacterium]